MGRGNPPAHIPLTRVHREGAKMIIKKPIRKMEFAEQDESFVKQLAKDIGCHYSKANDHTYSLNKFSSEVQGEMGVFAWVHKEEKDYFWVATRKIWIEQARTKANAGKKTLKIGCLPRDTQHGEDSVSFDTRDGYQKTVSSLRLINSMR
jgi:hypothetical protein